MGWRFSFLNSSHCQASELVWQENATTSEFFLTHDFFARTLTFFFFSLWFFFFLLFLTIIDLQHYASSRCIRKWSRRTIAFAQQLGPQSLKLSVYQVLSQGAATSVATTEEKVSSLLPLSYRELWVCLCACLPGWQSPGHMPFLELQEKLGMPVSSFFLSCSSRNLDSQNSELTKYRMKSRQG